MKYYNELKKNAAYSFEMIEAEFLVFENYAVIKGFLGYPHILTILEFIENVKEKEFYFLGTAGSLNRDYNHPLPLETTSIHSSAILDHFAPETAYPMKSLGIPGMTGAKGVSVDIIQRETVGWFKEQTGQGIDFVEMEIFPLRVYLGKPFYSVVVTSDLLTETGINVFPEKKQLASEFVRAYEIIVKHINDTQIDDTQIDDTQIEDNQIVENQIDDNQTGTPDE